MSTESVLTALSERGIVLIADGPNLRFHPRDQMTPELLRQVRAHKAALLVLARRNGGDGDEPPKTREVQGGFVARGSEITSTQPAAPGQELVPLRDHVPESAAEAGFWASISAEDDRYLTGPRILPKSRCPWCGGYLVHPRACKELSAAWEPTLPYGKYRGRRVWDVPVDYLRWMLGSANTLSPDLRVMIERRVACSRETGHAG